MAPGEGSASAGQDAGEDTAANSNAAPFLIQRDLQGFLAIGGWLANRHAS